MSCKLLFSHVQNNFCREFGLCTVHRLLKSGRLLFAIPVSVSTLILVFCLTGVQQGRGLRQLQPQHVGAVSMEQQDGEAQRQRQASGTSQRQLQPPQPQVKVLQHAAQASMAAGGSKAAHQEGRNSTNQAITGASAFC